MSDKPIDDLTTLLRAGDPAAGDPGLDARERASLRQRILAVEPKRERRASGWLAPAAAALALLALGLGLSLSPPRGPSPRPAAATPVTTRADAAGQQIQFTTDNGTLVVWVLQPRQTG